MPLPEVGESARELVQNLDASLEHNRPVGALHYLGILYLKGAATKPGIANYMETAGRYTAVKKALKYRLEETDSILSPGLSDKTTRDELEEEIFSLKLDLGLASNILKYGDDPDMGPLIKSLTEKYGEIPPDYGLSLRKADNVPEAVSEQPPAKVESTAEQKADRLLRNVTRAEFDSFQEYSFISVRSEKGFKSIIPGNKTVGLGYDLYDLGDTKLAANLLSREDDIVPYTKELIEKYKIDNRSPLIALSVAGMIDPELVVFPPLVVELKNRYEMYCLVGKKEGKIIIQGGGMLHRDAVGRNNFSSFKLVFDSEVAANEYLDWLERDHKNAYGTVLKRAIGDYDEQGNFRESLIPPKNKEHRAREYYYDPFEPGPSKVMIKDLRVLQDWVLADTAPKAEPEQVSQPLVSPTSEATADELPDPFSGLDYQQLIDSLKLETPSESSTRVEPVTSPLRESRSPVFTEKEIRDLDPVADKDIIVQLREELAKDGYKQAVSYRTQPKKLIDYLRENPKIKVQGREATIEKISDPVLTNNGMELTGKIAVFGSAVEFKLRMISDSTGRLRVIYDPDDIKIGKLLSFKAREIKGAISHLDERVTDLINNNIDPSWKVAGYHIDNGKIAIDFRKW